MYRETTLLEEKDRIACALCTVENEEIMKEVCLLEVENYIWLSHFNRTFYCLKFSTGFSVSHVG